MQSVSLRHPTSHEIPERKRVLVSVSCSHIDLLIAHELRPGAGIFLLNAAADAKEEARTGQRWTRYGAVNAVIPRMLRGVSVWIDGEESLLSLQKLDVKPGSIGAHGAGMVALGRFRAELPESPLELREISITTTDEATNTVHLEFRLVDEIQLLECSDNINEQGDVHVAELTGPQREWIRIHGCSPAFRQ